MRTLSLVLACEACLSVGRRLHNNEQNEVPKSVESLQSLLLAMTSPAFHSRLLSTSAKSRTLQPATRAVAPAMNDVASLQIASFLLAGETMTGPYKNDLSGPNLDGFFIGGFLVVFVFAVIQLYTALFPENEEWVPPVPGLKTFSLNPFVDHEKRKQEAIAEAEVIRKKMLEAAETGDYLNAMQYERDLKNVLWENGIQYVIEDAEPSRRGLPKLPKNW
mmetsp:Transcript_71255/g.112866  ORF Transcript_71255/g.112866 Transcript_71255/m.112866 type:complete len:219 (+) Transcript_71255:45-701(+)